MKKWLFEVALPILGIIILCIVVGRVLGLDPVGGIASFALAIALQALSINGAKGREQ